MFKRRPGIILTLVLLTTALPTPAAELVANGGFESNSGVGTNIFPGWTEHDQTGSSGSFYAQKGTTTPISHLTVPPPPAGTYAVMADESQRYTSSILYQDITLPADSRATLTMQVYVNNRSSTGAFSTPSTLNFSTSPNSNQQARVDIMNPNAAVDDMGSGILLNVFQTKVGDPPESGYTTITADLSAFAGQTIRLRIAQVDNVDTLNFGIDSVSIESGLANVPTLSRWGEVILAGLLLLATAHAFRRRVILRADE